jgi:predicted small secreted protein
MQSSRKHSLLAFRYLIHHKNEDLSTMKNILLPLLAMLFLTATASALTGCNTVEGVGKDIQQGGEAIKDKANEHRD